MCGGALPSLQGVHSSRNLAGIAFLGPSLHTDVPVMLPLLWCNQQHNTCASGRLYSTIAVAPGGIGQGTSVVMFGGHGTFGSGQAGEISLWDTAADTWTRLAVDVSRSTCLSCFCDAHVRELRCL